MIWQYIDAQQKFQKWVEMAQNEPQVLTRDGEEVAVLISKKLFEQLKPKKHILQALRELPFQDVDMSRSDAPDREIEW